MGCRMRYFAEGQTRQRLGEENRVCGWCLDSSCTFIFWLQVITVSEEEIIEAMRLVYMRMKLVIEPSAAVGVVRAPLLLPKINQTNTNRG
jgi:threonine synthase